MRLGWKLPGAGTPFDEAVAAAQAADVVVFVGGLTAEVEGEEMRVNYPGFAGGDRTDIELPVVQRKLVEALHATGKPVVLVLTTGSALGLRWAHETLPAIVVAWYPGQRGGDAVADVLFGDASPAGRLPVTFYESVEDLPGFSDYRMEGRTYRYFRDEPVYPFGHGLSYTRFTYSGLRLSRDARRRVRAARGHARREERRRACRRRGGAALPARGQSRGAGAEPLAARFRARLAQGRARAVRSASRSSPSGTWRATTRCGRRSPWCRESSRSKSGRRARTCGCGGGSAS